MREMPKEAAKPSGKSVPGRGTEGTAVPGPQGRSESVCPRKKGELSVAAAWCGLRMG